jgi:Acetyltransferase (GNAT) domain
MGPHSYQWGTVTTLSVPVEKLQNSSEAVVRRYRAGDEFRIVPFLERGMGWPAIRASVPRLDHWQWKFLGNPVGFHLVCVAELNGDIVSHSASLPVRMKVGERTLLASQGVDLCTEPACRGRGLIGQTMECRNQMKDEHGVTLDFGFPNQAAYHLSMIKQGFQDLGVRMLQHRYIIDEEQFFRKVRFGSLKRLGYYSYQLLKRSLSPHVEAGGGITLDRERTFGPEFDDLYQRAAAGFDLIIARDHRYLNWRYADPRGGEFIIRTARKDGRLVGFVVHKQEEREGSNYLNVVDAIIDPEFHDILSLLLLDAISMARDLGIETILCCLPENHPYEHQFADMGFLAQVRYTGDRPMSIIYLDRGKAIGDHELLGEANLRPHIMLGDTDWV